MGVVIEYDPSKDTANRLKHGVSLAFGGRVFDDPFHIVLPSLRQIDGEDRYKAVGMVDGRLWTTVYVERGRALGLISVRRSNGGEQRSYDSDPR